MGTYSTTFFCQSTDPEQVAAVLRRMQRTAFVLPPKQKYVLVYDLVGDEQGSAQVKRLTSELSLQLDTTVITVLNRDDDLLEYYLFANGELKDNYLSTSAHSDAAGPGRSATGAPFILSALFEKPKSRQKLATILSSTEYLYESERYEELAKALGLPYKYAQLSYREIAEVVTDAEFDAKSVSILSRYKLRNFGPSELPRKVYDPEYAVRALVRQNRLISAIDLYRREKQCSLEEAHSYVMSLKR